MSRRIASVIVAAVLTSAAASPIASQSSTPKIRTFRVEDAHSSVTFSIGFLGFPVRGRFHDVRGTLSYATGDLTASSISVAIPVKSLTTGSEHRDEHLRSSDFFDAEKFPYIVFRSESVTRSGGQYVVTGPLTMHGVTKTISIPFTQVGAVIEETHGSTLILFRGGVRLARKDFGIVGGSRFNSWFDDVRSATMSDSVDV